MAITISRRVASVAAAAAVSGLVLAGCSTDDASDTETTAEGTTSSMMTSAPASETSAMQADPAGMLVGPGCADYAEANPEGKRLFDRLYAGELPEGWDAELPTWEADAKGVATRKASAEVIQALGKALPELWGGSADLA